MGISSTFDLLKQTSSNNQTCFAKFWPSLPSWPSLQPVPTDPHPHPTHPPLPTKNPKATHPNPTLMPTQSRMTTPVLTSMLKNLLMVKLSLDHTKLLFLMVVSKLLPTPLITTTAMLLMSATLVRLSTPNTTPNPTSPPLLTSPPPLTSPLPKKIHP